MKRLLALLLLFTLLAAACQPALTPTAPPPATATRGARATRTPAAAETSVPVTPTVAVTATTSVAATAPVTATAAATSAPVTSTTSVVDVNLTPAQLAAVKALTSKLQIPVKDVGLVSTEAVVWPNGCLGIVLPGVLCANHTVPGFRIVLSAGGREYEYHTNQDGTTVLSTQQAFAVLRVAVRAADNSVQIVDTGFGVNQASQVPGLLPLGGSVGSTAYVLDFKDQPQAQMVDQSGTHVLPFVQNPNYGLAVWPGNGSQKPRLAWGTSPSGQTPAPQTVLYMANVDGSDLTAVVTETITSGQPPYQLVAERWSADGQSLYFSREPVGIGGYIPFSAASSLYRYSLADKTVTALMPFNPQAGGKMLCLDDLTPDASLEVGTCVTSKAITVHSLAGAPDQTISAPSAVLDYRLLGGARFSPDATQVAFALAKGDPSGEQGYVAVSNGVSGPANFVALSPAGHYYTVVAWLNANTLLLQDNVLACNPTCLNSLWTIGTDGANLTKVADGTFLTLVSSQ